MVKTLLEKIVDKESLNRSELEEVFAKMLSGDYESAHIAALLVAWRIHGVGGDHFAVGAEFMRQNALKPNIPDSCRPLLDNCGTGGSGFAKFNISTATAIVASACGVRLAKHGSKSVSSKCGSADLLFAAGFPEKISPERAALLLEKTGLTFFYAPNFHPVMKHVMPTRKALGIRTIFNLLGPLANPVQPEYQLLGVGAQIYAKPIAEALTKLGLKKALVVHSDDGLDEVSPVSNTTAYLVDGTNLSELLIEPKKLGINAVMDDVRGGSPEENLQILNDLLDAKHPKAESAVLINAGVALWLYAAASSIEAGVQLAGDCIQSGAARKHFDNWIELANE